MKSHKKHADIARPDYGFFGRSEWAIVGTPCGNIKKLASDLIAYFSKNYKIAYVDADHAAPSHSEETYNAIKNGVALEYTDKISFHRFDTKLQFDVFQYRQWFNEMDVVLVNGNHFQAKRQIVIIDPKKEESLKKRLPQLTDVQLILFMEGVNDIYPFLKEHLPDYSNIPTFQFSETEQIRQFLASELQKSLPPVYGLVLAGGESRRMGQDKGSIKYHGKPQRDYIADLLCNICEKTFISGRPEQQIITSYSVLHDTFLNLGPFGAILSAFRQYPNVAWMVVACDLPMLDGATLQELLKNRNPSKIATAFQSPIEVFPEPLITIWEPKAYSILLQFLGQGYSCPRKVLINSDIALLQTLNPDALRNVNEPAEMEAIFQLLNSVR
ncbi:MAG: NTP transferase domain-containing protein [Saprospiraceae bacterium]|nr:NTP transferase domain-containing protein [Saprospiraceae bacterium]